MDARRAMKQAQQSSRPHKQAPAQRKKRLIPCFPGMQNILNFARFCIYLAIVSWAAIVLGLACNFEKMLVSSDLTRFVPLAIFIAVTTMLVVIGLLLAPFALRHNPISTLYELVLLAFLGIFWLVLGLYTATAEMGDVECYADEAETEPIEYEAFTTDIYHAQYRALEGFALINVFMLLGFLFFMLLQAFIQHRKGYKTVWSTPLPMYPWFGRRRHHRSNTTHKLPPPATHKDQPKGGKGAPEMSTKPSAGYVTKFTTPPAVPPKAAVAGKAAVYRSQSLSAPKPAAAAPRPPVRSKTVTRPSGATATANAKTYPSQYTRPAGQSSNSRPVPPKQSAPAPAKAGQKSTSAAVTRQPSQRR